MYNKDFFQKHFALTPTQADDYAIAFGRICYLLQDYDPLHHHRRNYFYHYEKEALLLLQQMPATLKQAKLILQKAGFVFANTNPDELEMAARKLLSIADCYVWPASIYDDWKGVSTTDTKETFTTLRVEAPRKTTRKKKG